MKPFEVVPDDLYKHTGLDLCLVSPKRRKELLLLKSMTPSCSIDCVSARIISLTRVLFTLFKPDDQALLTVFGKEPGYYCLFTDSAPESVSLL